MSLNLEQKKIIIAEVGAQIADAQAVILAEYRGLEVSKFTQLRAKTRECGIYFRVVKNSFVRRAVKNTPYSNLADQMVGPLVYGIGRDPVATAKVLHEFAKNNDKFVIKAGAIAGTVLSNKEVAALASLPSREELLSRLMGTLQAPIAKFVRTLNEVPTSFVRGLAAIRDHK